MRRHKVNLEVQALAWLMGLGAAIGAAVGFWTWNGEA